MAKSDGAEGIRTPDPLLAKPRIDFPLASENVRELLMAGLLAR